VLPVDPRGFDPRGSYAKMVPWTGSASIEVTKAKINGKLLLTHFLSAFGPANRSPVRPILQSTEQFLKKHENLPVDRLYLASWSGFTEAVVQLVQVNPGFRLVTPDGCCGL
jgi:hypothetical protein